MSDRLGTGRRRQRYAWQPFKQARAFVQALQLSSVTEWQKYCKGECPGKKPKPKDIPRAPEHLYRNKGWQGWGDWLGTGNIGPLNRKYRSFTQARAFVRKLKLSGQSEWRKYCKNELSGKKPRPYDIPSSPSRAYQDKGWKNWGDWLGTKGYRKGTARPFRQARAFIHKLRLSSVAEWIKYCKGELPGKKRKPADIPSHTSKVYQDKGWKSWGDWLGTGRSR